MKSYGNMLTVYLNTDFQIFANRIIRALSKQGVTVVPFQLPPKKIISSIGWWLKLIQSEINVIHYLWGLHHPLVYILSKLARKKVIVHWIGTDVLKLSENPRKGILWKIGIRMVDLHLTDFQPLAEELKILGIDSKVVPLIADIPLESVEISWPQDDQVFVYLPEIRKEFFSEKIIFQLAEEMPNVNFLIACYYSKDGPSLKNIKYLGFVQDMDKMWEQVKVYLRIVEHDGLSHTVIEALARGKQVIWSCPFPHCFYAKKVAEVKEVLENILKISKPNIEGMEFAQSEFNPNKIAAEFKQIYLSTLRKK